MVCVCVRRHTPSFKMLVRSDLSVATLQRFPSPSALSLGGCSVEGLSEGGSPPEAPNKSRPYLGLRGSINHFESF